MNLKSMGGKIIKLLSINYNLIKHELRMQQEKRVDIQDYALLPSRIMTESQSAFVLSTGRCGTMLLAHLLETHPEIDACHEATPTLVFPAKLAYERWKKGDGEMCELAILSARYELIRDSFLRGNIYVETNNRLTFFAPQLASTFMQAKFIHLVRHPGAFVRSAIRRGYYSGRGQWDEGRITPLDTTLEWEKMSEIEKNSWLWNETNEFIERFKEQVPQGRILTIKAEDLYSSPETTESVCRFLGVDPLPRARIERALRKPVNVQRGGGFPRYTQWSEAQKAELRNYAKLAQEYDYAI